MEIDTSNTYMATHFSTLLQALPIECGGDTFVLWAQISPLCEYNYVNELELE